MSLPKLYFYNMLAKTSNRRMTRLNEYNLTNQEDDIQEVELHGEDCEGSVPIFVGAKSESIGAVQIGGADKEIVDDHFSANAFELSEKQEAEKYFIWGLLLIAGAGLIFSIVTVLTAIAGRHMPSFEFVFISSITRWTILAWGVHQSGESPLGQKHQRSIILLRCFCGSLGYTSASFAFTKMTIGDASAIIFSAPAWASIFGRVFIKEDLTWIDIGAVAIGLSGVVMLTRPEVIFGDSSSTDVMDASSVVTDTERTFAPMIAMLGSMGAGGSAVCVRHLGTQGGLKPVVLAHAYSFFLVLLSPVGFLIPGQSPHFDFKSESTWLAILAGVLASVNQVMFNTGMMRVPSGLGSMMRNIDILACYVWQVALFKQDITTLSIFGSLLIICATVGQALRKVLAQRQQQPIIVLKRNCEVVAHMRSNTNDVGSTLHTKNLPAISMTAQYLNRHRGEGTDV